MALANILSALSAATNAQGNDATIPGNGQVRDASLAQAQPVTPTPQGKAAIQDMTGPVMPPYAPPSAPPKFQIPMAAPSQQTQPVQTSVAQTPAPSPLQPDQNQQGLGDIQKHIQDYVGQLQAIANKPAEPWPTSGQLPPFDYNSIQNLLSQANQARQQAASQPVPQPHGLGLIPGVLAGLLSTQDRSGQFAHNFLQNFQQEAQQQQQGALQQYQQNQNAANITAQGLEQQAQNQLQQRSAQLAQNLDDYKEKVKLYVADQGLNGKMGVAAQNNATKLLNNAENTVAKQLAQDLASKVKLLASGSAALLKQLPNLSPEARAGALDNLRQSNPDVFGNLPDSVITSMSTYMSPKELEQQAQADEAKAKAQMYYGIDANNEAWRDPKRQQIIAQATKDQSIAGLNDSQTNLVDKKVANFDDAFKLQANRVASQNALNDARIQALGQGDFTPSKAAFAYGKAIAGLNTEANLNDKQIKSLEKKYNGAVPDPQNGDPNSPQALDYQRYQNLIAEQGRIGDQIQGYNQQQRQFMPNVTPNVSQAPGGAANYGSIQKPTNVTPPSNGLKYVGGNDMNNPITLPNGTQSTISQVLNDFNKAIQSGRVSRLQAIQALRKGGITVQ